MILVNVVPDETMIVAGFERYTMQCLDCGDTEQRFVFKGNGRNAETAADAAAAIAREAGPPPAPMASAWLRAVARLGGRQPAGTQRRAEAEATDRVRRFYRAGEDPIPPPARPPALKPPPKPKPPRAPSRPAAPPAAAANGRPLTSWERAVAKLR